MVRSYGETHREGHGTVEAEIGVNAVCHKPRTAKDCQQLPEARKKQGKVFP